MARTSDYSLRKQFQDDLITAYKQVAGTSWSQREAYERMVKQPAPRFYVTPKAAYRVLSLMFKGDFELVNDMLPLRRKMYYDLFEETKKISEQRMFVGKSLWYIVHHSVLRPAPEFYISWDRAKHIRIWMKKGRIRLDGSTDWSKYNERRRERRKAKIGA